MKDVTEKFANMIDSFECDLSLAMEYENDHSLNELQEKIENEDEQLIANIMLLKELCCGIRNGVIRIIEQGVRT